MTTQRLTQFNEWLLLISLTTMGVINTILPRAEKNSAFREELRGYHYLIGSITFCLALWRLWRWYKGHAPAVNEYVAPLLRRWSSALYLAFLLLLIVGASMGPFLGWSEGHDIHFASLVYWPTFLEENRSVWMFTGYFHSGLALASRILIISLLLTGLYGFIRYGQGLFKLFGTPVALIILFSVCNLVYALSTFKSPEPGPRAVATFLSICLVAWLVSVGVRKIFGLVKKERRSNSVGVIGKLSVLIGLFGLLGFGLYAPHMMFRVTPWPMGEVVTAAPEKTYHENFVTTVTIAETSEFEQEVAETTYKWCRFCHTVEKGAQALVGPNLYAIFGQQAGTVPNFYYSEAMAKMGKEGLVWNDETIAAYIAGPDAFVPGTSMIISSGPVLDEKIRAAVVNLLKRDTMSEQPE